jgi:hypothetical protein
MTKRALLEALEPFDEDDEIIFEDMPSSFVPKIERVCGGRQAAMPYYCTLPPGHEGRCHCFSKDVDFDPESPEELQAFYDELNRNEH